MRNNSNQLNVLITGRNSFIGRHLCSALQRQEFNVIDADVDVLDIHDKAMDVDIVVHLASKTDNSFIAKHPHEAFRVNVCGTLNVLEFCRRNKARLVFPSSCGVYAEKIVPVVETDPLLPKNPYTACKHIAEQACLYYARDFGIQVTILRLFNVFGFGQSNAFLLSYVFESVMNGEAPVLKTPFSLRDFVYIADVCDAIIKASWYCADGAEIFNIGSGTAVPIIDVVRIVYEICNVPFDLETGTVFDEPHPCICSCNEKAQVLLGWRPQTNLRTGISLMLQGYR